MIDSYGVFEPERRMFVDQGWLMNETEIQLRFYNDPILMFKVVITVYSYTTLTTSIIILLCILCKHLLPVEVIYSTSMYLYCLYC